MSAPDRRDLLKNAVAAVEEMRARVQAAERAITEPIAIVGIGCRMPGGVTTPEELWTLLAEGRDAITEVPPGRWSAELYEAMAPEVAASAPRPRAGFVDGLDQFDPHFFSISPREAASMDPQHRMVLEASWQALEHASIAPDRLRGSLTGVFVGITAIDYAMHVRFAEASRLDVYTATGSAHNAAAGRISYVLGLQGPSMAIDTACSSSLAAVHLACQSLRLRECNLALAGGVNTIVIPDWFVSMTRWGMLAPDGRCKAFDRDADGMVRAEGCGIVALKRLSDAEADGDRILAVVLGSAVNQDGASGGLTVPNGRAQAAVIRQALRAARVAPADVSYVEAHGTGTTLGDPIELEALDEVMSEGRASSSPMVVGSIKTNLGHLEAAAGIAGLIKVVLSLQHEMIPRNLHFTELNPAITLRSLPVTIPRDTVRWPRQQAPRIAGVSSFGLSGTNAHVVLREAPPRASAPSTRDVHLLTLSARSDAALRRQAARWRDRLMAEPALHPGDVAHAANTGRAALPHRATIIASGTAEFASKLNDIATGAPTSGTSLAHAPRQQRPRVAMMFTGQGSQYAGMGRELHASQPVFRGALDRCSDILQPILGLSLAELVLQDPRGLIDQTAYTQPALFAVEYALYETWRSWGISPAAVLGHSVGEYVAACIAGVFSLEDGLRLIAERGRLMQQLPAGGTMAAVLAPESAVRATLDTHARDVSIAAVNGPDSIVISGPASSVASAIEAFEAAGFGCRLLQVSHAFHSSLMDPVLTAFGDAARAVTYHPPSLPLVSNVSGDFFADGEAPAAGYWTNHLRNAVRFGDGVATLERAGYNVVLEVGPAPALTNMARRVVSATSTTLISSLRRDQGNWAAMLSAAGALFRSGATVDWDAVDRGLGYAPVSLPTYPFERERYWIEAGVSSSVAVTARIEEAATSTVAGEQLPTTVLYEVDWQSLTIAVTDPAMREGSWIVVGNPGKVANAVVDQLRSSGARAAVLPVGGWHAIKPAIESGAAPRRVVITTGCDAGDVDGTDASALRASIRAACDPILQVTQALLRDSVAAQIVILTSNAQAPAGAASVDVAHASVWGLGRALRIEHPELQCKLIDVRLDVPIDATAICQAILDDGDEYSVRGPDVFAPRLIGARPAAAIPVRTDGSYLVTGGFGALGAAVARSVVARGARHLVLVGRTTDTPEASQLVAELTAGGAQVQVVAGDISNENVARRAVAAADTMAPLRGVTHAAGVTADAVLAQQDWQRFEQVFAAKVIGAWHLHHATQGAALDFFTMFSSAAALLPTIGQANYAAANAAVDGLAHLRRSMNLPAVSINWGPWGEGGMASRLAAKERDRWHEQGISLIEPEQGVRWFGQIAAASSAQTAVLPVAWDRYLARHPEQGRRHLLAPMVPRSAERLTSLVDAVAVLPQSERRRAVHAAVVDVVRQVLAVSPAFVFEPRQGLRDLGLDSLMAVELRNALQRLTGSMLPSTIAYDCADIEALTSFIAETLQVATVTPPVQPPAAVSAIAREVEELSDDDAEALLAQELNK